MLSPVSIQSLALPRPSAYRPWPELAREVQETADLMGITLNEAFHLVRTLDSVEVL
jgi:hypothetical protein